MTSYQTAFEAYVRQQDYGQAPKNLYEPMGYILNLGGKRLRPVLTLMSCDFFGTPPSEALDAALAVEMFHNFSLIHDDIMDQAPLRRGKPTVHEKWDVNTGILSGDLMLITAYRLFEKYPPETFRRLAEIFSTTAVKVCEGQQLDMDFEQLEQVSLEDYLQMIAYKTGVLLGAALQMGGIIAGAAQRDLERVFAFGTDLGIAFQLQDDYLDAFGKPETFGKQPGGDIVANKKTFLYINALENLPSEPADKLRALYRSKPESSEEKIAMAKQLFENSGAADNIRALIREYTDRAIDNLQAVDMSEAGKETLTQLAGELIGRSV